jgi:CRP/FNR family transcriptional regulator, cyclic AMP receptor protein
MTAIHLFRNATGITYAAIETIFAEGEIGDSMYVVVAGELDIIAHGTHIATLGAGSIVGEMALLDGQPRSATVVARTKCVLAPIDRQRFQFLVDQTPLFATQVMRMLAERLRQRLDRSITRKPDPGAAPAAADTSELACLETLAAQASVGLD